MLIYKNGDILKATENLIAHQVNVQGVFGGGLALQIAKQYPNVEKEYQKACVGMKNDYQVLKGQYIMVNIGDKDFIANCFTQKPNFDTDYVALKDCFIKLLKLCKGINLTIAVPYGYGCGISNGNWDEVETILRSLSEIYGVDISVYKLEK